MDLEQLAESFFAAAARSDWEGMLALCADDAVAAQNGAAAPAADAFRAIEAMVAVFDPPVYSNVRRIVAEGVVVEEHTVTLGRSDGDPVVVEACVVIRVDDAGRIVRLDEYVDSAPVTAALA